MKPRLVLKTSRIAPKLSRKQRDLGKISQLAHRRFKSVTPKRTGNAKRRTRLQNDIIKADYPYATRLDNGYSRQARDGMSEPTIKYIQELVKRIIGR